MEWWVFSVINSFLLAIYMTMNGRYKLPGNVLIFNRSFIVAVCMLPFMFIITWSTNPLFYIFAIGIGIVAGIADIIVFTRIAKYGGAVISRLVSFKIWIVFIFWLIVSPSTFLELWAEPLRFFAILSVLGLGAFSLMHLNKCPISSEILFAVLFPIFMWASADIMFKQAMLNNETNIILASLQLVFIISIIMVIISVISLKISKTQLKPTKRIIKVSALFGLLFFTVVINSSLAFKLTPNPSYVVVINSLNVVWIYIYHKIKDIPDESNVVAGMLFVLSSIGLVLLTV